MENIYNIPGSEGEKMMSECVSESNGPNIDQKFINAVTEIVIQALDIGHQDRRIVRPLLKNAFSKSMDGRYREPGLLQQYEASILELASKRIKSELNIPDDIKVNHEHATHAKLADIVEYIKDNYKFSSGWRKQNSKK